MRSKRRSLMLLILLLCAYMQVPRPWPWFWYSDEHLTIRILHSLGLRITSWVEFHDSHTYVKRYSCCHIEPDLDPWPEVRWIKHTSCMNQLSPSWHRLAHALPDIVEVETVCCEDRPQVRKLKHVFKFFAFTVNFGPLRLLIINYLFIWCAGSRSQCWHAYIYTHTSLIKHKVRNRRKKNQNETHNRNFIFWESVLDDSYWKTPV